MPNPTRLLTLVAVSLITVASAVSAAPSVEIAQAQTPPQNRQQARPAPQPLSKSDYTKFVDNRFSALDANKDGFVTKEEIAAAQTRAVQQATAAEQQRLENEFKRLDTNKDNQLSLSEYKASARGARARLTPDQALARMDGNKDGRISLQEYRAAPLASFDNMDANKDGTLAPQEVQAARRR